MGEAPQGCIFQLNNPTIPLSRCVAERKSNYVTRPSGVDATHEELFFPGHNRILPNYYSIFCAVEFRFESESTEREADNRPNIFTGKKS